MTSYVYFIRPVGMLGPIKIGYSETPAHRLETLMAWSPFPLEIAATVPGSFNLEQLLHRRFLSAHLHREWFNPVADLIKTVQALQAGAPLEEAVDLSGPMPVKPQKPKRSHWSSTRKERASYCIRAHAALRRAQRIEDNDDLRMPAVAHRAVICLPDMPLGDAERAVLDAFIADPVEHSVTVRDLWPIEAAQ